jgi:hypothetical protein
VNEIIFGVFIDKHILSSFIKKTMKKHGNSEKEIVDTSTGK